MFRRSQNWIGAPGCTLDDATYVPAPPERLRECLDPFEQHLHAEQALPPLLSIACLHYQFEAIHPFIDGNGRVGRLLVTLLMDEWGLLPCPCSTCPPTSSRADTSTTRGCWQSLPDGDWTGWLAFFLAAVEAQAIDVAARARRLQSLRDELRARVAAARSSALLGVLIDSLFASPAITISQAARLLEVTPRAARLNIDKLVGAGVLIEVGERPRNKVFLAYGVLDVVEGRAPADREVQG